MLKILSCLVAMSVLTGCAGVGMVNAEMLGGSVATMWATKPSTPPEADLDLQMAQHESWCYSTMGSPQCYTCAQDVPPSRLINVDPPNRYPLTVRDYNEALVQAK